MSQYANSFAKYYDLMYNWKDYAKESAIIKELIKKHGKGGRKLLEVACGTGNYLVHLKNDLDVTGVDLSEDMLKVAAQKLPGVKLVQGNMKSFRLDEKFDAVICLFSSIAYMKNEKEMAEVISTFYDHLNPGGITIIETFVDPGKYDPNHIGVLNTEQPGAKLSRHNVSLVEGNTCKLRMHTLVSTRAGTEYFVEDHDMTMFDPEAIMKIMRDAGFEALRIENGLMDKRSLYIGVKK
jgi:ubiquinone/menaquinone biosynthesis C-methylase UbiE